MKRIVVVFYPRNIFENDYLKLLPYFVSMLHKSLEHQIKQRGGVKSYYEPKLSENNKGQRYQPELHRH